MYQYILWINYNYSQGLSYFHKMQLLKHLTKDKKTLILIFRCLFESTINTSHPCNNKTFVGKISKMQSRYSFLNWLVWNEDIWNWEINHIFLFSKIWFSRMVSDAKDYSKFILNEFMIPLHSQFISLTFKLKIKV
jgi:hypothetical protein